MINYTFDFRSIFEALPGNFIILQPDSPHFTIIAISDDILRITTKERKDVVGKSIFEVYPENPEAVSATGPSVLKTSLQNALESKKPVQTPVTRYDILNMDGTFEERYWSSDNKPVLNEAGEVSYIIHASSDVTAQVMAEKSQRALRKIEKTYHLFMQAPVAVFIVTGPENIVELANEEILQFWGKSPEIVGKPLLEAIPEAKEQGLIDIVERVRKTGVTYHATQLPVTSTKNGSKETRYYNVVAQPYYENSLHHEPSGVFSLAHDVTEQVLARQKIEESEQQVRSIIESSHHPIAVYIGKEMRILLANQAFLKTLGKNRDIIGKRYKDVLPEFENQEVFEQLDKVFTTGIPYNTQNHRLEVVIDGKLQTFYFDYSLTPLYNAEGKIYGIVNTGADVTALALAQQKLEQSEKDLKRFKFMADQARDSFILMREDGTFAYLNQKALETWGYTEEEARHIRVPDVDPIYQDELFSAVFAKAQKENIPQFVTLHKRKDGHIYTVEVNMGGLLLGGEPHMFAVARDITERKQTEEALEQKNAELIRINNDLDNFIYTASHDLKAPISNIEGLLQALQRTLPPESLASERAQRITILMQESVERFKKTIANLTDVSKLQKENSREAVSVNLADVIKEVTLDLEPLIQSSDAQVEIDLCDCSVIHFSEKNLRSVIYNLLSNGIKYRSPDRTPRVQITCKVIPDYHLLTISDNGLGIKESQLSKLFSMFKRFHDHVEGTGIGLYMIKKMVENAGGKIEVESQLGKGTTFKVYFPR